MSHLVELRLEDAKALLWTSTSVPPLLCGTELHSNQCALTSQFLVSAAVDSSVMFSYRAGKSSEYCRFCWPSNQLSAQLASISSAGKEWDNALRKIWEVYLSLGRWENIAMAKTPWLLQMILNSKCSSTCPRRRKEESNWSLGCSRSWRLIVLTSLAWHSGRSARTSKRAEQFQNNRTNWWLKPFQYYFTGVNHLLVTWCVS